MKPKSGVSGILRKTEGLKLQKCNHYSPKIKKMILGNSGEGLPG